MALIATVVAMGSFMGVINATIVNLATHTLSTEFHRPISTIQWVVTAYALALASAIPVTGWASERFGIKRVWLAALLLFTAGSALSGAAWSAESLIVFRIAQGVGGGMLLPTGQAILAQAAGPQRMGRVLGITGVPLVVGAVATPVIGGLILSSLSWRWVFFINLPFGLLAIVSALWLLPKGMPVPSRRLDLRGLVLLSSGVAILIYSASRAATGAHLGGPLTAIGLLTGVGLIAVYVVHARARADGALIDIALLRRRGFATGAAANFAIVVARSGGVFLLPLYWQIVHGESPLATGLLLAPQAAGAALATGLSGWMTDRIGAIFVVPFGIGTYLLGAFAYTQVSMGMSYAVYIGGLLLLGFGQSAVLVPTMATAYATSPRASVPRATSAMLTIQRFGEALGTAVLAVVLQLAINARVPQLGGSGQEPLPAEQRIQLAPALSHAFGQAFWVVFGLAAITLIPALLLPRVPRSRAGRGGR